MLNRNQAIQEVLAIYDKLDTIDRFEKRETAEPNQQSLNLLQQRALEMGKKEWFRKLFDSYNLRSVEHHEDEEGFIVFAKRSDWLKKAMSRNEMPTEFSLDELVQFFDAEIEDAYRKAKLAVATEEEWAPDQVAL